jgi:hypothetical protein
LTWTFARLWNGALSYERFVAESTEHCGLWTGIYRTARIPDELVRAAMELNRRCRILVIVEDWCGDATNTVPILVRWVERLPNVEIRLVRRDQHPTLMDAYLTGASRSIPIVVVLTEDMEELGHWGPRPAALQAWVSEQRRAGARKELYPEIRRWYAKDHGETTLREILAVMAGDADAPPHAPTGGSVVAAAAGYAATPA